MINYQYIADSIEYYEKAGFKRVESPWTTTPYIENLTKPYDIPSFQLKHNNKCLVGSGEQSFLYLYLKDFLPKGQFQTVTPCFRFEMFDYLHTKYFMKNELIKTDSTTASDLDRIVQVCLNFYKKYVPGASVTETSSGFDIECAGIELGSYGIRECEFLKWIYATGVAEPRLSKVIQTVNGIS